MRRDDDPCGECGHTRLVHARLSGPCTYRIPIRVPPFYIGCACAAMREMADR